MKIFVVILFSLTLLGCVEPAKRFNLKAKELGLDSEIVSGSRFQHKIFFKQNLGSAKPLHVYLDGDGTPWERNRWEATDPTARNPLILRLMSLDKKPSMLLGRPCYYGLYAEPECENKLWTSHRYSEQVVRSMAAAMNLWLQDHPFEEIVLIGYSGGGALAVLLADKIKSLTKIVTVSANLNTKSWVEHHEYLPLSGSLNPSDQAVINSSIQQIHIAGEDDTVIPAEIIKGFSERQSSAQYIVFEGQSHACCWEDIWLDVLKLIDE